MSDQEWTPERKARVEAAIKVLAPVMRLFRDSLATDEWVRKEMDTALGWVVEADEYARTGHFGEALYWLSAALKRSGDTAFVVSRMYGDDFGKAESEVPHEPWTLSD